MKFFFFFFFFGMLAFSWPYSVEHDEKSSHTKFDMNWFMVAQDIAAWMYLISRIEISINWPGSYMFGTRSIYTDFNRAN